MRKNLLILCAVIAIAMVAAPALFASIVTGASPAGLSGNVTPNPTSATIGLVFQGAAQTTITPRVTESPPPGQPRPMGEVQHPITHPIQRITPSITVSQLLLR